MDDKNLIASYANLKRGDFVNIRCEKCYSEKKILKDLLEVFNKNNKPKDIQKGEPFDTNIKNAKRGFIDEHVAGCSEGRSNVPDEYFYITSSELQMMLTKSFLSLVDHGIIERAEIQDNRIYFYYRQEIVSLADVLKVLCFRTIANCTSYYFKEKVYFSKNLAKSINEELEGHSLSSVSHALTKASTATISKFGDISNNVRVVNYYKSCLLRQLAQIPEYKKPPFNHRIGAKDITICDEYYEMITENKDLFEITEEEVSATIIKNSHNIEIKKRAFREHYTNMNII